MTNVKRLLTGLAALAVSAAVAGSALAGGITLRASHQWPGGKGDVRDEMVQIIKREAEAAGVGIKIQVYPGKSLFKPKQQWEGHDQGATRYLGVPARLRQRQAPAVQRHPHAGPGQEPRPCQAPE